MGWRYARAIAALCNSSAVSMTMIGLLTGIASR